MVMALLALWLPASNHCRLELLPGLDFLTCCTHDVPDADTHHKDDCQTDSCETVEAGLYKTESHRVMVPAPVLVLVASITPDLETLTRAQPLSIAAPGTYPPELPKVWQFTFRAAAPPRAPSIAS